MKYYYLLNGKIMAANEKMPTYDDEKNRYSYDTLCVIWHKQLQSCEISESELEKVIYSIVPNELLTKNIPIEVTEIVEEKTIYNDLVFKHPKQVEEIEAVELINWMHSKKADKSYKKGYWFIEINKERMECSAKQLYEIFKNQK